MNSNDEHPLSIPIDLWEGWRLTPREQTELTRLTLHEFTRPIRIRKKPEDLVKKVVGMYFSSLKSKKKKNERDKKG
jgi:hypothetical protein